VREHNAGLRWTLLAEGGDRDVIVVADTSRAGTAYDVHSDDCAVDLELELAVRRHIAGVCALHRVLRQLHAIESRRWGRSDRLRRAA
jgi:hypothetical protein